MAEDDTSSDDELYNSTDTYRA